MRFKDIQLLQVGPPIAFLLHTLYYRLGLSWRWDRLDWCVACFTSVHLARALWVDSRTIHHAVVIAPRERRWQCERAERRARRAAAAAYLRNHER